MLTPSTKRASEAGVTLVELLVVMVLFGVVGTIVTSAIVTSLESSRSTTARTMAIHELEVALQRVGRDLRAADPLYISGSDPRRYDLEIGAEVMRDRHVHIVSYELVTVDDQQQLVAESTIYDLDAMTEEDAPDPVETAQTLVTTVDNGDEPVFRYYDRGGNEILCDPDDASEDTDSCDAAYGSAKKIGIRLMRDVAGQSPVRTESMLSVRNTRYESGD